VYKNIKWREIRVGLQALFEPAITPAMNHMETGIPWGTSATWREANESLAYGLQRHRKRLAEAFCIAGRVRDRLTSIFPIMDALCAQACPGCMDICCRRAWVWADFRDLLFLHLAGIPVPEAQLISRRGGRCRYVTPAGCRLARLQRPFVCTWYVCPAQTCCLDRQPDLKRELTAVLAAIKQDRRQMEDHFIDAMVR
jgi:hypothetical protein